MSVAPVGVRARPAPAQRAEAYEVLDRLAARVGLQPASWQRDAWAVGTARDARGRWRWRDVAIVAPRQNGKTVLLELRELAELFIWGGRLVIHTAHDLATARESMRRLVDWVGLDPEMSSRLLQVRWGSGDLQLETRDGGRIIWRTRTRGALRGFSGVSLLVLDEAMRLTDEELAALLPATSAHENPQLWFAGSAGLHDSVVWWRMREQALRDGGICWQEWTAEEPRWDDEQQRLVAPRVDPNDRRLWRRANPALGTVLWDQHLEAQLAVLGPERFAREHLGVWDPLEGITVASRRIPEDVWEAARDRATPPVLDPVVAWDCRGLELSTVVIAWGDGRRCWVEVVEHKTGRGWVAETVAALAERWGVRVVGANGAGMAAALHDQVHTALRERGLDVEVHLLSMQRYARACEDFVAAVHEGRLHHVGQEPLDVAVRCVRERPLGEGWAWDGRGSDSPVSPLVAATVARALLLRPAEVAAPVFAY